MDIDIEMTDENGRAKGGLEPGQGAPKRAEDRAGFPQRTLKSHQKQLQFPEQIKLQLGSMEINFLMSAQERVISSFKSNKRYIEKELSQLFQNSKKLKRSAKDGADDALSGFDSLIAQIDRLKEQYQRMLEVEDKLMNALE